jgi:transcriptional regulator NrdR family protein
MDSRPRNRFGPWTVERRRECKSCKHRFSTIEIQTGDLAELLKILKHTREIARELEQARIKILGFGPW